MKLGRGRRAAVTAALAALLSLGVGAYALRGRVLEWWWIRQLDSEDEAAVRHAATRLAEAKAVRAIPRIVARLQTERSRPIIFAGPTSVEVNGEDTASADDAVDLQTLLELRLADFGPEGVAAWLGSPEFEPQIFLGGSTPFARHPTLATSLFACLSHTDPAVRLRTLEFLGNEFFFLEPTFRAQLAALRDPERDIRKSTLVSLCEDGFSLDVQWAVLPDLVRSADPEERVRLLSRASRFAGRETEKLELIEHEIQRGDWTALAHYGTPIDVALRALPRDGGFPVLVRLLSDPDPRAQSAAVSTLRFLQEDLVKSPKDIAACADALLGLIERCPNLLEEPLALLGNLCPDDARTLPTLLRFLESSDPGLRAATCNGLAALGPRAAPAVPALIRRLDDFANNLHVCTAAAEALGAIGPQAEAAVPRLLQDLKNNDANDDRRRAAVDALFRVAPKSLEVFRAARDVLFDSKAGAVVRQLVARLISRLEIPPEEIVPVLSQTLADQEETVRDCALLSLKEMGPRARAARDALIKITNAQEYTHFEWEAVEALWAITGDVDLVINLIQSQFGKDLAGSTSNVLAAMGPRAVSAVPLLQKALDNADMTTFTAWRALSKVQPDNPRLLTALADTLRNVGTLRGFLDKDLVDRPLLVRLLSRCLANTDLRVRLRAVNVLKDLGRDASAAAPDLEKLLADPEEAVRLEAQAALRRSG